jgi:hypothetical protein
VGIEETTNMMNLDVTVKDDAWAVLAAVKANVTILGKAGVTTTNRLDVEVKRGSDGKLLFSQQLAVFGDDGWNKLGFALKQFCDGAQDINSTANIDVVKQTADAAASVQVADNFIFSGSTAVAVADGKTCSVKANIVGSAPGRTDGIPALAPGAALSTAQQCLAAQKCYSCDLIGVYHSENWTVANLCGRPECQTMVKAADLMRQGYSPDLEDRYAFRSAMAYDFSGSGDNPTDRRPIDWGLDSACLTWKYKNANKDQFQTDMNSRYGTSGCRFQVQFWQNPISSRR